MTTFFMLPSHAAQCLGTTDLTGFPRCAYGFDADFIRRSPEFAAVIRERDMVARQHTHRGHAFERKIKRTPQEVTYTAECKWRAPQKPVVRTREQERKLESQRRRARARTQARRATAAALAD